LSKLLLASADPVHSV